MMFGMNIEEKAPLNPNLVIPAVLEVTAKYGEEFADPAGFVIGVLYAEGSFSIPGTEEKLEQIAKKFNETAGHMFFDAFVREKILPYLMEAMAHLEEFGYVRDCPDGHVHPTEKLLALLGGGESFSVGSGVLN